MKGTIIFPVESTMLKHTEKKKSSSGCYPRGSKAAVSLARGEGLRSPGIGSKWSAVNEQEEK